MLVVVMSFGAREKGVRTMLFSNTSLFSGMLNTKGTGSTLRNRTRGAVAYDLILMSYLAGTSKKYDDKEQSRE